MSYLVLARKWRPQTFTEVVGQEHVTRTLCNAITSGRVAHAFLFTGPRGVGKTTTARLLAKALNCEKGPTPEPCNACSNCLEITAGTSLDVLEIDGASHTGVDNIRDLTEGVQYRPVKSHFRVIIIDEVHMLSNAAFNALLKTLEEPPPHVKFIFATTESHKILPTILSRCQRYDFKRIPLRELMQRLNDIVTQENLTADEVGLALIAREADGGLRDAQSLLDQVIAWSDGKITEQAVKEALGVADRQALFRVVDAILARDPAQALRLAGDLYQYGYDPRRLSRDLLNPDQLQKVAAGRELMATYRKNQDLINIGAYQAGSSQAIDQAIALRDPLNQFLRQNVTDGLTAPQSWSLLNQTLSTPKTCLALPARCRLMPPTPQ